VARQWTPRSPTWFERARAELQGGTTGSDLTWGDVRIRAGDLPLFRRSPDGKLHQSLRVVIDSPHRLGAVTVSVSEEGRIVDEKSCELTPGLHRLLLFVPERESSRQVDLVISAGGEQRFRATVETHPQRKWAIFLIHHSHLDIGYTDPQPAVLRHHLAYLDSVLDLVAATDEWPDSARFRWNVEATLPLRHWLSSRPPGSVDSFMDRVREGRVEITALPFSMYTEAYSIDELARQLWFADELRDRYGVRIDTAMQTDVPGATTGLLHVLADAGVRFLSVAHNYAGRSVPHLVGGQRLTRPFQWTGDAGDGVCVWLTDTPHGLAYMEGNMLGLAEDYEAAVELVPEYLAALAQRPYPYSEPIFGWAGPPEEAGATKRPYPHDILHLRVQGSFADNAPPSLVPSEIARRWSSEWAYPQLRVATNRDFFDVVEDRLAGSLDEFRGDWTDWWADGLGSDARALGFNRRAQAAIRTAQTLHALGDGFTRERSVGHGWWEQVDAAFEDMALFDEHTWGAANPWEDRLDRMDSGAIQRQRKAAFAYAAWDRVEALTEAGLQRLVPLWGNSGPDLGAVVVLNPASVVRSDVATCFLPESRFGTEVAIEVVDVATGEVVPRVVEEQDHAAHRPRGHHLSFVARDVPPLGYALYRLRPRGPMPLAAEPVSDEASIENEHYRVEIDPSDEWTVHVYDKAWGVDLVRADAPFGFNQYIYDRYGTAPHFNHLSSRIRALDLALLGSRSVGGGGAVTTRSSTPVWDRLTVRLSGEGVHWIETVFTLTHGVKRLDITNRLHKIGTAAKESAFFAFPFNVRHPDVTYEITGGTARHSGPFVPGSARHMRAIGHWVAFESPDGSIAWATREAPLIQLGNLFLPYAPFPATLERDDEATVYSWIVNNIWDTNFPSSQQGEMEFRYALASDTSDRATDVARETASSLTTPLLAVLTRPPETPRLPARGSFCRTNRPDVEIVALTRSRRDHDLVVWLHAHVTKPTNVALSFPLLPVARAWQGTHLERRLEEVPVEGREVQIGLVPGELATLSVRLDAPAGS
jgi:hypothetical protein